VVVVVVVVVVGELAVVVVVVEEGLVVVVVVGVVIGVDGDDCEGSPIVKGDVTFLPVLSSVTVVLYVPGGSPRHGQFQMIEPEELTVPWSIMSV
jgi:hypothetical protein